MMRLKPDAGPFGWGDDCWEIRPWADDVVASWLSKGRIDRRRAIALLSVGEQMVPSRFDGGGA